MRSQILFTALLSTTAFAPAQVAARPHASAQPRPTHATPANDAAQLPAGIPALEGKLETAFALKYIDARVGEGALAEPNQYYTVHYTGWLASNGTKFDSSVDRGEPITFPQGAHRVIPGWDSGFTGMHVGGKRRLFIPYQLAYGEQGRPPVIPPKSDLIFDIELVSVSENPPEPPAAPPASAPGAPPPGSPQ